MELPDFEAPNRLKKPVQKIRKKKKKEKRKRDSVYGRLSILSVGRHADLSEVKQ